MSDGTLPQTADRHVYRFRKSLPLQLKLQEIVRAIGSIDAQACLDVGAENGLISYQLRRRGGKWSTVAVNERTGDALRAVVGDEVYVLENNALPFSRKKIFDMVIIAGGLERLAEDDAFVEECHRVLKPDGRLVVCTARIKSWTLLGPLRRLLGLTYQGKGFSRPGYTEAQLFSVLKTGFDVHSVRTYSRFHVELVDTVVEFLKRRIERHPEGDERSLKRLYAVAGVIYWIAFQIDMFLLFNKGHRMVAVAKRRAWRSREAPVLVDGRSISEAVLSKAAD